MKQIKEKENKKLKSNNWNIAQVISLADDKVLKILNQTTEDVFEKL